jgi:glycerol-3-phosphate acyltransferase PlsY
MIVFTYIILIVTAYILGSIPSAVWAGRFFHGVDVREHGRGNAGTTNVIRGLGWKTGIPVLIIDMIKGWAATMLPALFHIAEPESTNIIVFQIIAGLTAITGHIFPVFAGFRGGKV